MRFLLGGGRGDTASLGCSIEGIGISSTALRLRDGAAATLTFLAGGGAAFSRVSDSSPSPEVALRLRDPPSPFFAAAAEVRGGTDPEAERTEDGAGVGIAAAAASDCLDMLRVLRAIVAAVVEEEVILVFGDISAECGILESENVGLEIEWWCLKMVC